MSTCRFSQRVAMVSNRMEINEEVDPKLLVARLKSELRELKESLAGTQPAHALVSLARTVDQAKYVLTFIEAVSVKMVAR